MDLDRAKLVAQGHVRLIYEHPDLPGALIKVIKPALVDAAGRWNPAYMRKRFRRLDRLGGFLSFRRELTEFLVARCSGRTEALPVARIHGFAETQLGFGLVVEKLTAPSGELAPTLLNLLREGRFEPQHGDLLKRMFEQLAARHICVGDVHPKNVVFAGTLGDDGRFVCVDGTGNKAFIPLAAWSKAFNERQLKRGAAKLFAVVSRHLRDKPERVPGPTR